MARTYEEAVRPIVDDDPSFPQRYTIEFVWNPRADDYRRVWQHASERRKSSDCLTFFPQAFMDLDVAGLSAAQRAV